MKHTITDLRFHLKHQLKPHEAAHQFYFAPAMMQKGWIRKQSRDFGVVLTATQVNRLHKYLDDEAHTTLMKRVYQEQRKRGANLFIKKPQGYPEDSNRDPKEPEGDAERQRSFASPLLLTAA